MMGVARPMKKETKKEDVGNERAVKELNCLSKWAHGEISLSQMRRELEGEGESV